MPESRTAASIFDTLATTEGDGLPVRRAFPTGSLDGVDPFLLLDHFGPVEFSPGGGGGVPDHPHRGFETVTYILEGRFEHRDSAGHAGVMGPGDVQWMTAGSGIVHSEMPEESFRREGGRLEGLQLWVNLPRADKMMDPRYQHIDAAEMPSAQSDDGAVSVKVIAGEALGAKARIDTRVPISYLHFTIRPGHSFSQPVRDGDNAFVYVVGGEGAFGGGGYRAAEGQLVAFSQAGDSIAMAAVNGGKEPLSCLLLSAAPLDEPVARYGPFVMNTKEEIIQAIDDFNNGRLVRTRAA